MSHLFLVEEFGLDPFLENKELAGRLSRVEAEKVLSQILASFRLIP
ncbi:MAG: hypothetical protein HYT77_07530 [Deltaproteobacteria bacterium]|nr:hypothetical protein [Deltaproteobacteria bacterium]